MVYCFPEGADNTENADSSANAETLEALETAPLEAMATLAAMATPEAMEVDAMEALGVNHFRTLSRWIRSSANGADIQSG